MEQGSTVRPRQPAIGWDLPSFYCPLESAVHPCMDELEREAISWADAKNLYANDTERAWGIATHSSDFSCRIIPHGRTDIILLFIQWNLWAFAVDDHQDSAGKSKARTAQLLDMNARLARSLETPGCGYLDMGKQEAALNDLITRTWSILTPFQLRRFAEGVRDWLFGAAWQASNIERGVVPSLNDYLSMRPSVNGTRFSVTFSEVANHITLQPDTLYSREVQAITDMAGFIVSCDNDLFSYAKEDDEATANIVDVIAHQNNYSPKDAVIEVLGVRDCAMTIFLELRQRLQQRSTPDLTRYLDNLAYYISGSIRWMSKAPRYASPRNRNEMPIHDACYQVTWRNEPAMPEYSPLNIPTMAYWKSQLESVAVSDD